SDERRVDGRRRCWRGFETELQLTAPRNKRRGRDRRRRRGVLIRRREPRHETAELEVAEQLEHGGAVVCRSARALELERHREIGDDGGELAASEDLILVRRERFAE